MQHGAWLHAPEEGAVDRAAGPVVGGDVDGDDIGAGETLVALDHGLVARAADGPGGNERIVHHHAHVEGGAEADGRHLGLVFRQVERSFH